MDVEFVPVQLSWPRGWSRINVFFGEISVSMWENLPENEANKQKPSGHEEWERERQRLSWWLCWALHLAVHEAKGIPGFLSSQSQGEMNSQQGLNDFKSRIDMHIKQRPFSKEGPQLDLFPPHCIFKSQTHYWSASILELTNQAYLTWPQGEFHPKALSAPVGVLVSDTNSSYSPPGDVCNRI